jgi:hypothetical protein
VGWTLAALTVAAALVRFGTLGAKGYWGDELSTVYLVHQPLPAVLDGVAGLESTPPLYYLLAWGWAKLVPTTEVGIRALSALWGVALVPVSYLAARELVSTRAALIVPALVAFNPLLAWYSQEARSYALLALLSALGLLLFLRASRRRSGWLVAGWALASAAALATHYFAAFLIVPQAVWLLRSPGWRRGPVLAVCVVTAVSATLLPLALHQRSLGHADWIRNAPLAGRAVAVPAELLVGFDAPYAVVIGAIAILLALVAVARLARRSEGGEGRGPTLAAALVAAGAGTPLALAIVGVDYFNARNVIGALVPLLIVIAAGFAVPARAAVGRLATLALCGLGVFVVAATAAEPKYHSEDWRAAAHELGPSHVPRLIVATPGQAGRKPLEFYLSGSGKLPPAGREVGEVDLLFLPSQGSSHPRGSRAISPAHLGSFRRMDTDREGRFVLWRYRSPSRVWVTPSQLRAERVATQDAVIIWQRSRPQRPPSETTARAERGNAD